ncbi:MAG: response regulator transcription factor [Actinomycetota bacterium]
MRILLVEDDAALTEVLVEGLRDATYAVDTAGGLNEALEACRTTAYDLACIDLALPDGDGLDLLRRLLRSTDQHRPHRIIVITARDAVEQRVAGLDAGADDYLVKPFAFAELVARVRAVSRREDHVDAILRWEDLTLDTATMMVVRDGHEVSLTGREFSILRYLLQDPGRVVSAEELLEHVWDANADPFTSSVRVLMSRLRRKLGAPPMIETVTGAGYRIGPGG